MIHSQCGVHFKMTFCVCENVYSALNSVINIVHKQTSRRWSEKKQKEEGREIMGSGKMGERKEEESK